MVLTIGPTREASAFLFSLSTKTHPTQPNSAKTHPSFLPSINQNPSRGYYHL
jgi:hypothetical protein